MNTITQLRARGFTLIELLVVIAIIGLLSTIIAAPIQNARKKARDAKKIAELKSLQLAIEQYGESNDANYPLTLSQLSPAYMPLLPTFSASTTSSPRDAYVYVTYTASSTGSSDQIFSFHIGSKLEVYGPALDTDRDCVFGLLGSELDNPFCSVYNGDSMMSTRANTGSLIGTVDSNGSVITPTDGGGAASFGPEVITQAGGIGNISIGEDFFGGTPAASSTSVDDRDEDRESTCKDINDCIFDITSQQ